MIKKILCLSAMCAIVCASLGGCVVVPWGGYHRDYGYGPAWRR
jgi:hypothetical protein